jgi:uncharacterized coiled-coil protein SlyX
MWQITWILSFLPDWFWTVLLISSIASVMLSRFFLAYKLPMKIVGAVGVVLSVWMLGAASNEAKWEARVKELEEKLAVAEEASKKINTEVVEKVVTKTKVVQSKAKTIVEYVDREIVKDKEIIKYVEMCPVPTAIIDAHNAAATLNKAAEGPKK